MKKEHQSLLTYYAAIISAFIAILVTLDFFVYTEAPKDLEDQHRKEANLPISKKESHGCISLNRPPENNKPSRHH